LLAVCEPRGPGNKAEYTQQMIQKAIPDTVETTILNNQSWN